MEVSKGFIALPAIIFLVVAALAGGALVYYQSQQSEVSGEQPATSSPVAIAPVALAPTLAKERDSTPAPKKEVSKTVMPSPTPPQQAQSTHPAPPLQKLGATSDAQQEFVVLEGEVRNAQEKKTFFSPEHATRILSDLLRLEENGYLKSEIEKLRQIVYDFSPHLQDQAKQSQSAPSAYKTAAEANCASNATPLFTNDITDMSKVNYIGPPPTMGAGPSLKTHSYIGTDHARVPVYAPAAMALESGSHYIGGPYMMEFRVSCEVKVRFGHITEPVEVIRKLLPSEPKQDSRTEELTPITFAAGELVGYTTGTDMAGNWDFGVYNSTVQNRYADDPDWGNSTTYTSAICPFDYFPAGMRSAYVAKFNSAALGGNPPHGEPFCAI